MAATVIGFAVGIVAFTAPGRCRPASRPEARADRRRKLVDWAPLIVAGLGRCRRLRDASACGEPARGSAVGSLILARQYRLSTAALLIGLAGASIYLLFGSAGYTSTFEVVIQGLFGKTGPSTGRWLLLLAVLAGMLVSTLKDEASASMCGRGSTGCAISAVAC